MFSIASRSGAMTKIGMMMSTTQPLALPVSFNDEPKRLLPKRGRLLGLSNKRPYPLKLTLPKKLLTLDFCFFEYTPAFGCHSPLESYKLSGVIPLLVSLNLLDEPLRNLDNRDHNKILRTENNGSGTTSSCRASTSAQHTEAYANQLQREADCQMSLLSSTATTTIPRVLCQSCIQNLYEPPVIRFYDTVCFLFSNYVTVSTSGNVNHGEGDGC